MIGGPQGLGVDTSANVFSNAIARAGYYLFGNREYYSNIKGRHSYFEVVFDEKPVRSISSYTNILATFDAETLFQHFTEVTDFVIYGTDYATTNIDMVKSMEPEMAEQIKQLLSENKMGYTIKDVITYLKNKGIKVIELDYLDILKKIAAELKVQVSVVERAKNMAAVGASIGLLGLPFDILENTISSIFRNDLFVKMNVMAAKIGYNTVNNTYHLEVINNVKPRIQIDGNTIAAMGKIAGGLRFQSYYPITPASDESVYIEANQNVDMIVEGNELRKGGVVVVQAEDELAAINMAIGAALTGARTSTATSGPGFSLMAEGLSWAGMNEVPVVVTYYMRGAPSTGLPTRSGQADLKFALNAGHGEFPRIVIASGDHHEIFWDSIWALNLAERYQTPVIHIIEKALANAYSLIDEDSIKGQIKIDRGKLVKQVGDRFNRFQPSDDGISPRVFLGQSSIFYTGDEHNEEGHITENSLNRTKMHEKRMKKLETADNEIPEELRVNVVGDADIVLITWGSPKGAILDAMSELEKDGIKTMMVQVKMFNPYPTKLVKKLLEGKSKIVAVENNYQAQGAEVLAEKTGIFATNYVLKWSGRPITREEIINSIKVIVEKNEKKVVLTGGA
ncbi:2-oxoacid:ferredoxin oxidoreductase subunit alpha [Sulfolobus acidocaldarius]|uniref:2-oxoacid oxidoreductase (ferredoxin) n=4 Tax=Sulfolobus acidocaldarius TaxID=2285 RepID=Q4J6I9_SULAC|nr:2-oxoacid:ferredoxin oxidoreductase subunit alpha [Sulfolobus acidocaldarius]AAY81592.1 pyruvate flavodoxin/ferredoxin oxidoreductase [Sulfolobus acidocaldarius DSM 639]AGE72195.1 pyruvate flavodoxin/ferredoxin oxidoreductase [Sulfolobus acidocaldarius N8]AGE74513.1 pyruvate flavodoxin/ferredoxin oxidoreductase [Sulfolobus acidocaldarius Ron12/I]ALU29636.1 2-oxoacid:ferredoxin oxidoreductase subunit alpha [Sulfolobus acidocaldarius]ALU32369.1 2-oxoacid:ferredoxin oxidoreductase subunit alph